MSDRTELLEAALDSIPEGIALLGNQGEVLFWNRAAEAITGYVSVELRGRNLPETMEPLLSDAGKGNLQLVASSDAHRGARIHAVHKLGHAMQAMARSFVLRDGLGGRIGTAILFHPAESLDALPHGETGEGEGVEASQSDLEDRLATVFSDFSNGGLPMGVLWITVDQAHNLRKTHGAKACEAMLGKVERMLSNGLRPGEEMGRWGDDEFLVVSHERTHELLAAHGQLMAGLARTADFRWWGDRVSLTVSIGAAQAEPSQSLAQLLERAQEAMVSSIQLGGNHVTTAPGGQACLPS
jgi:PAS domain S-box-containing protein/diguanylate cyclase (GGDEF)-like protein